MKKIPIGIKEYKKLIEENYYAVDKTLLIQEFLDRSSEVTLITRPRRFGKTLNMSMMAEFFDITKDSKQLFKDTRIMKTKYASYINQYPTIFVSFANAKGGQKLIIDAIKTSIKAEYQRYSFLFNEPLDIFDQNDYQYILKSLLNKDNITGNDIVESISFLMKMLEKYYGKKVMVFIDEYDTPFIEAHINGFYNEIRYSLSSLLHNALKSSTSLQYSMLTGIQRVAKENIFSDLNNLVVCTVADKRYDQYFGFDTEETSELLEYYHLSLNEAVKQMYDGYHIGNQDIFNPWSIINYADNHELISYWVNTSSNQMIRYAISKSGQSFNNGYKQLIQDGYLDTTVSLETSFYEVSSTSSLWGLFVNAGYLTIERIISSIDNYYRLRIPNQEVEKEFKSLTTYYLNVSDQNLDNVMSGLKYKDKHLFMEAYQSILMTLPSYYDLRNENSYHLMLLGLCQTIKGEYKISSNKENGLGRADIILESQTEKPSYIIELKYSKEKDKLQQLAKEAIEQIMRNHYDHEIKGEVIYIGIAHCGKEINVQWKEKI